MATAPSPAPLTRRPISFALLTVAGSALYIGTGAFLSFFRMLIFWGIPCASNPGPCDWDLFYLAGQLLMWGPAVMLGVILYFSIRAHSIRRAWARGALALAVLFGVTYVLSGFAVGWPFVS